MKIAEFKPTVLFLGKFLGLYVVLNLLYGVYLRNYDPRPDPATHLVSENTVLVLNVCGWSVESRDQVKKPTTYIIEDGRAVLSVYEGCNGLNSAIIFIAFVVAFGPYIRAMAWFLPLGIVVIHVANLARISLLFVVSKTWPDAMYFVHKYLFTAVIYAVIFLLWLLWIRLTSRKLNAHAR